MLKVNNCCCSLQQLQCTDMHIEIGWHACLRKPTLGLAHMILRALLHDRRWLL
jgi:hypothetical protein